MAVLSDKNSTFDGTFTFKVTVVQAFNTAPRFVQPELEPVLITAGVNSQYPLPAITDEEGHMIAVDVKLMQSEIFATYNAATMNFLFAPSAET